MESMIVKPDVAANKIETSPTKTDFVTSFTNLYRYIRDSEPKIIPGNRSHNGVVPKFDNHLMVMWNNWG